MIAVLQCCNCRVKSIWDSCLKEWIARLILLTDHYTFRLISPKIWRKSKFTEKQAVSFWAQTVDIFNKMGNWLQLFVDNSLQTSLQSLPHIKPALQCWKLAHDCSPVRLMGDLKIINHLPVWQVQFYGEHNFLLHWLLFSKLTRNSLTSHTSLFEIFSSTDVVHIWP